MATNLLPINTFPIRPSAASTTFRHRTTTTSAVSGGGKWWTPLFGWSTEADYIDPKDNLPADGTSSVSAPKKYVPGGFTEEKAKELRLRTKESFHDVMYHSAIASRLASDFSDK